MLKSDLLGLIAEGEGSALEFKRGDVGPEGLAKAIASFANMKGGIILLGVDDTGVMSGVHRKNSQEWLFDTVIKQYIHPQILTDYKEFKFNNETVVVITVPEGAGKPYAVKNKSRQDYYVRYGNTTQRAEREELARLFQIGGLVSVENMPIHGSGMSELDMRRLEEYFEKKLCEENITNWEQMLLYRDLLVESSKNKVPLCSYASYMLFANNPRRRLPQAGVRIQVFSGTKLDYNASLDEVLDYPFVGLREENSNNFTEESIPARIIRYLQPFISEEQVTDMQRQRHWDYPIEVIRELLINAFAHRDWTRQNDVHLTVFSDRLEIDSPGALPNGITIEKIKAGQQTPRNTNIVRILRDYGFMEGGGMGIRRKVIPLMSEHNGSIPAFEADEDFFKVTLYKK